MKKTIDYTALADTIRAELNARHDRSAWGKAVTLYALDLLEDIQWAALWYVGGMISGALVMIAFLNS